MFAGHLGAGLAAKAVAPKIGLGTLLAAALLLDIAFWLLLLVHAEAASAPSDFSTHHYLVFNFPWSHSLVAALAWAGVAGFLWGRGRLLAFAPLVVAATVFSHWLLDVLVHFPDMPLWDGEPKFGLGLWRQQPLPLVLEIVLTGLGLAAFWLRVKLTPTRRLTVAAMTAVVAVLTASVLFQSAPPPGMTNPALSSLAAMLIVIALAAWADNQKEVP